MLVYLVRHGIAVAREDTNGQADADRELTDKGRMRLRQIVRALGRLRVCFDEIWTSPLRRAAQTAAVLAEAPWFDGSVCRVDALAPGGDFSQLAAAFRERGDLSAVCLVGHEPDLGLLATQMLGGPPPSSAVRFKKGGIACVEMDAMAQLRGRLRWLLTPRQMRMMD